MGGSGGHLLAAGVPVDQLVGEGQEALLRGDDLLVLLLHAGEADLGEALKALHDQERRIVVVAVRRLVHEHVVDPLGLDDRRRVEL